MSSILVLHFHVTEQIFNGFKSSLLIRVSISVLFDDLYTGEILKIRNANRFVENKMNFY